MNKRDILNGFTIFVATACLLTFILNTINGRFQLGDFKVYYSAAESLVNGGPVYQVSFYTGSGYYKYSPATLFFFIPYLCFSFKTASVIHFFLLGAAYWYTFKIIRKLMADQLRVKALKHEALLLTISFCCILIHFARELYLGNINILLLMLCCLAIREFLCGRNLQGGLLLGIAILAKPYLVILLLPLVFRSKWKAMAWLGGAVTFGLLLPLIFPGPAKFIGLYGEWIKSILSHGEGYPGMTSLDYAIRHLLPSWPDWGIIVILALSLIGITALILNNLQREKRPEVFTGLADMNFAFEWFLLIALLPNLIKTDWVLLLFSAPLITFIVFHIASRRQYWWIPLLIVLLFFYGANSDDLLGRELSHKIMVSGLMGLSNFLLAGLSLFIFLDHRKRIT